MRASVALAAAFWLLSAAIVDRAQAAAPSGPPGDYSGWQVIDAVPRNAQIACGELPVLVQTMHASLTLVGACGYVRVAGAHLDITIELASGGTIEATGEHNDIYWRQNGRVRPPTLINAGSSNSFHAPR